MFNTQFAAGLGKAANWVLNESYAMPPDIFVARGLLLIPLAIVVLAVLGTPAADRLLTLSGALVRQDSGGLKPPGNVASKPVHGGIASGGQGTGQGQNAQFSGG